MAESVNTFEQIMELSLWLLSQGAFKDARKGVPVYKVKKTHAYKLMVEHKIVKVKNHDGTKMVFLSVGAYHDLIALVALGKLPPEWMAKFRHKYGQGRAPLPLVGLDFYARKISPRLIFALSNRPT